MMGYGNAKMVLVFLSSFLLVGAAQAAMPNNCPAPTPAANEALAKRWVNAVFKENPIAVFDDLLVEDYVHNSGFAQPVIEGREAYKDYLNAYYTGDNFGKNHVTVDQVVATPEKAVVAWTINTTYEQGLGGTVPAGTPIEWTAIAILQVRCGKVAEAWVEADHLHRFQQIGAITDLP